VVALAAGLSACPIALEQLAAASSYVRSNVARIFGSLTPHESALRPPSRVLVPGRGRYVLEFALIDYGVGRP